MSNNIETAGVNPGSASAEELVEVTFHLPASVWDGLKKESVAELKATDEIVALALQEHFQGIKDADIFEGYVGVPVEELTPIIHLAAWRAALDYVEEYGEITVPPKFVLVPSGCAPMFLSERTVRYARECCAIVDVDADEWVEGWIGEGHIEMGLNGGSDVTFAGIGADLVENYGERTLAENQALYEKFREVALRYQEEVKQEAAASTEGGEA